MIGLISRWGKLGRRYLWPHLLLGIVAAGLGLPFTNGLITNTNDTALSNKLSISPQARIHHLIRLHERVLRPTYVQNFWHQQTLRTVIRHLSFSLPRTQSREPAYSQLTVKSLVALYSLITLLTSAAALKASRLFCQRLVARTPMVFSTGHWVAQVRGIRAGPLHDKN
ncbi:secA translation cis-regulator SecM [Tatumella ptyseos]|uniref:secA translation cis-regulator SecM n=1 Tax=Tatumella ptyseos TaxID=82987 RepID=UPI0026EF11E1|nr:secA translation cis-regulator SecM [Tatumella ptyseos]WKX25951.1 secA translation cis-regulator SecM [Tatumella ptyseos]